VISSVESRERPKEEADPRKGDDGDEDDDNDDEAAVTLLALLPCPLSFFFLSRVGFQLPPPLPPLPPLDPKRRAWGTPCRPSSEARSTKDLTTSINDKEGERKVMF